MSIPIIEENIISLKFSIAKNSKEEASFIKDVSYAIKNIDTSNLSNPYLLENATNTLASKIENIWRFKMSQDHKILQELVERGV